MPQRSADQSEAVAAIRSAVRTKRPGPLWELSHHSRGEVRQAALVGLLTLLGASDEVVQALFAGLTDRAGSVRRYCAGALADLGGKAWQVLRAGLGTPDAGPLCAAALVHAQPGGALLRGAELASQRLQEALDADLQPSWRHEVAAALAARQDGVQRLLAVAQTSSSVGARFAAEALRDLGAKAVKEVAEAHGEAPGRPWLTAVLGSCGEGRRVLRRLPHHGREPLLAALGLPEAPIRMKVQVCKALAICPGPLVSDALAGCLADGSVLLRDTATRVLVAREDPRAVPLVLELLGRGYHVYDVELVQWLGRVGDSRALPVLKKLASPWRALVVMPGVRHAAKVALEAIEASLAHIPTGAISLAQPPQDTPTLAAISLWEEAETAEEAAGG